MVARLLTATPTPTLQTYRLQTNTNTTRLDFKHAMMSLNQSVFIQFSGCPLSNAFKKIILNICFQKRLTQSVNKTDYLKLSFMLCWIYLCRI